MSELILTGNNLTIEDVVRVAHHHDVVVSIDPSARERLERSRFFVEKAVEQHEVVYGLTTGFGYFKNVVIDQTQVVEMQQNLLMSHAVGVGEPLTEPETRAMILVRINSLIKGYSGVRSVVVDMLVEFLNRSIYPYIPHQGSLGASGDLAPLSHMSLVMLGLGEAFVDGKRVPATQALARANLAPVTLSSKEGLALINGTAMMAGIGSLNLHRAEQLAKIADIAAAMSVESLMGSVVPFDENVQRVRPHEGQKICANNVRKLCEASEVIESHKDCGRVQDSYSLRCTPQVHGAVRDTLAFVRKTLEIEINSATDNPLIFPDENISRSAGNFHGEPIAFAMDFLGIATAELANIAERRIAKAVDKATSEGLPAFLIPEDQAGVSSGFMIAQYTAAALVSENKTLAHPDSVDSIPTSANQEDHVSMGANATHHAREIIDNVQAVLAIELLTTAQALDFKKPLRPGPGSLAAYQHIRQFIPFMERDRVLYPDIERTIKMVEDGSLLAAVERAVGKLE
ncbi:MAG: histidine ammonia-lyase [Candidatus Magasanikbacteria bacterium]|nr:histidine ammonia-lyase [Candidatus Magasanikbacteria bacterium]